MPEFLKESPPEAELRVQRERQKLRVTGTTKGLFFNVARELVFGTDECSITWRLSPFYRTIKFPRNRLQSVEPTAKLDGEHPPQKGFGLRIGYWMLDWRKRPRLRTLRIPVRTLVEQFWLLNRICGFLDETTRFSSPFMKYRSKEYFGDETLEMFFENRTVCMRIACPRCGATIPARSIRLAGGTAECTRKYCRHSFSWLEIFESPVRRETDENRARPTPGNVYGYGDLTDVRAAHFAANANPLASIPFGSETPSTDPLPMPYFHRPRIVRKNGELSITMESNQQGRGQGLLTFIYLYLGISMFLGTGLAFLASCFPKEFERLPYEWTPSSGTGISMPFGLLIAGLLFYLFIARAHRLWGRWNVRLKQGILTYTRYCLGIKKRAVVPYGSITEVGAKIVPRSLFGNPAEAFTPHQIHIRYGEKRVVIPCNNADEQLWIMGELYESLRKSDDD